MHQESPPGSNSTRPLFLMSNCCQPCVICSLSFKKWHGFLLHQRIDWHSPGYGNPPGNETRLLCRASAARLTATRALLREYDSDKGGTTEVSTGFSSDR